MKKIIFAAILAVASTCYSQTPQVQATKYLDSGTVATTLTGSGGGLYVQTGTGGAKTQVATGASIVTGSGVITNTGTGSLSWVSLGSGVTIGGTNRLLGSAITLSTNIVADGDSITDSNANETISISCTTVSGTNLVTVGGGGTAQKVLPGQAVTGTGIPAGTTLRNVVSLTQVVLSNTATASATNTLTFTGTNWPAVLQGYSSINGRATVVNTAVAGTNIAQAIARYTASVHPYSPAVSGVSRAIYIPLVGGVDMTVSPYSTITDFETLCNLAKADGFEVWACTIPWKAAAATSGTTAWAKDAQNISFASTQINNWKLLNRLIRESSVPDHIIDLAAQQIDTQSDFVHPTVLGSRQIAQIVNRDLMFNGLWPSNINSLNPIIDNIRPSVGQGVTTNRTDYGETVGGTSAIPSYAHAFNYTFNNTQDSTGLKELPSALYINSISTGSFNQDTTLPFNGIYIQHILQNSGTAVTTGQMNGITIGIGATVGKATAGSALRIIRPALTGTSGGGTMSTAGAIWIEDQTTGQPAGATSFTPFAINQVGTSDLLILNGAIQSNLNITSAGKTLKLAGGANACSGTVALVGGAATITSTAITTSSVFHHPTIKTLAGSAQTGAYLVAVFSGSATITTVATDTSTIGWAIVQGNQ